MGSISICSYSDTEFHPSERSSFIFGTFFNNFLIERGDIFRDKTEYKANVPNFMRFARPLAYLISRRRRSVLCDSQNDTALRFRPAIENSLRREYIFEKYFSRVADKAPLCLCVT